MTQLSGEADPEPTPPTAANTPPAVHEPQEEVRAQLWGGDRKPDWERTGEAF